MTYTPSAPPRDRPPMVALDWIDPLIQWGSDLEMQFAHLWLEFCPHIDLHHQYKFCLERRFTFDFAHYFSKVAIELQGGTWVVSGHTTGKGISADYEKIQIAAQLGWVVIPLTSEQALQESTIKSLAQTIQSRSKLAA